MASYAANSIVHEYDGNGLRVRRTRSGGSDVVYLFAGSLPIAEYTAGAAASAPTTEYIYIGGSLLASRASGATVTTRKMQSGANLLPCALYSNTGRTTNWGNTSSTNWVSRTGNGLAQPLTVYGQIVAGLFPTPGAYSDTITATVTY